ncbi:hypothetical protein TNCV_2123061 [Trichonephila clavipes]|nr:hypothetical protein TNCV_2123061 [Trichonephila clavipes]
MTGSRELALTLQIRTARDFSALLEASENGSHLESSLRDIKVALSLLLLNYLRAFGDGPVAGVRGGQGIESWLACLEFEPSATKPAV